MLSIFGYATLHIHKNLSASATVNFLYTVISHFLEINCGIRFF